MSMLNSSRGVTLVELMIAIAVLAVLTAIAIPTYNGYIREGHYATIRSVLDSLRTPVEDFRLEQGNYGTATTLNGQTNIDGRYGWDPGSDLSGYDYNVVVVGTNNYHVWGRHTATDIWVRCEDRFSDCCDSDASGATAPTAACP